MNVAFDPINTPLATPTKEELPKFLQTINIPLTMTRSSQSLSHLRRNLTCSTLKTTANFGTMGFSRKMLWAKLMDPLFKWLPAGCEKKAVRVSAILDAVMEHCYAESEMSVLVRASSG